MPMPPNTQMPVANQAAADRASTASAARMQSNAAAPSAGAAMMKGPAAAQAAAGAQAQEQGQIAAQAQSAEIQKSVGQAHGELQAVELRNKEQNIVHAETMAKRHTDQRAAMSRLGRDVEAELFTKVLAFDKTEREARFSNQRQMADYMKVIAKDQQTTANYQQSVQAAVAKDIEMMDHAMKTLQQFEMNNMSKESYRLDKELQERVKRAQEVIAAKLAESRKKAGKHKQMMGVAKMAVGAGAMYATGGTVGASMVASGAGDAGIISQEQAAAAGTVASVSSGYEGVAGMAAGQAVSEGTK